MYLGLIFFPLLGCVVSGFFGRKVGMNGAQLITCVSVIITTILAILCFSEAGVNNAAVTINLFRWMDIELFNILCGFEYDSLTVSMLIPVLIISSLVHLYSRSYMSSDPHIPRFFSYLSLFTFMMVILVTANNYLLMFVGWEGVGVCSYLLVSFWFTRIAANQSSISAFLTNRVGDCFLTMGMFAVLWSLGNLDYGTVFSLAPYVSTNIIIIIGVCLLIGAMAKSSQVGLHVWLPMAMEGPTPVSALIHAATMVTAGVYLLMRSSPLIEYSSTVLLLCLWLGAITTVFSSLVGLFQQDIKKIIAYSTMSQLGMMVIGIGLSSYGLALFHLINHAFYKALLFLGAGSVIHAVADNQDLRKYGGLINYLPLTYSVMLIASLSLVAFPFMTGFYSKDFILESAYGQFSYSGVSVYIIATIGAVFTTLYSVKVLYLTFLANPNGSRAYYRLVIDNLFNNKNSYKPAHEGDFFLTSPLIILALFSIFFGFVTKDIFIGLGSNFFIDNSLFIHPTHEIAIDTEFAVPVLFKLLPFVFTISFSIIALTLSELLSELVVYFKLSRLGYNIFGFFNQRFLIEYFYNKYITNLILNLGGQITKILDKGGIELFGPFGIEKVLNMLSKNISSLSTSHVTNYALYILVGFILYLILISGLMGSTSLFLIVLLLLGWITIGNNNDNAEAISDYVSHNNNNSNNRKNNSITYILNDKKMFSTSHPVRMNNNNNDDGRREMIKWIKDLIYDATRYGEASKIDMADTIAKNNNIDIFTEIFNGDEEKMKNFKDTVKVMKEEARTRTLSELMKIRSKEHEESRRLRELDRQGLLTELPELPKEPRKVPGTPAEGSGATNAPPIAGSNTPIAEAPSAAAPSAAANAPRDEAQRAAAANAPPRVENAERDVNTQESKNKRKYEDDFQEESKRFKGSSSDHGPGADRGEGSSSNPNLSKTAAEPEIIPGRNTWDKEEYPEAEGGNSIYGEKDELSELILCIMIIIGEKISSVVDAISIIISSWF